MNHERWARDFFALVDRRQPEMLLPHLAEDVRLQMANFPASVGVAPLLAAFQGAAERFSDIHHEITGIWSGVWPDGEVVSVEAQVHYLLHDGRHVVLPCTSTLRLHDGRVADYRIFIDPAPAFA